MLAVATRGLAVAAVVAQPVVVVDPTMITVAHWGRLEEGALFAWSSSPRCMRYSRVMRRLCIIPRWAGGPESDFYPWLQRALAAREPPPFGEVRALRMPDPGAPIVEAWVRVVREALGEDPVQAAETVLLGHSVGCQAVLRALAELPAGTQIGGAVLVAGWFWVDQPWATLRPWMDTPVDLAAARAACPRMVTLLSDDDPFTADAEANRRAWEERVGAEVRVVHGAKHFNAAEEPAVLEALLARSG